MASLLCLEYAYLTSTRSLYCTYKLCAKECSSVLPTKNSYNLHNEISIPSHHLPMPITTCTRGHSQRFRLVSAHLNVYSQSFFPATIKIWNSLPATAIEASNIDDFKKRNVDDFCISPAVD